jgi:hypothetical protein
MTMLRALTSGRFVGCLMAALMLVGLTAGCAKARVGSNKAGSARRLGRIAASAGVLLGWLAPAALAHEILDVDRLTMLKASGVAAYRAFLAEEFGRAFALSDDGAWGWRSFMPTPEAAGLEALAACAQQAKTPCRIYAANNALVGDGQAPPGRGDVRHGELTSSADYFWNGPAKAKGAIVWSHGNAGQADARRGKTHPYIRRFSNDGWDVYRFDRDPRYDRLDWATRHLIDGVRELRKAGYQKVIVAGQSRGAWHSLEAVREAALLDGVIAAAPAQHGTWDQSGRVGLQGLDDFRSLMRRIAGAPTPIALFLFEDDPYDPDPAARAVYARERLGAGSPLLLIDRPAGITGHSGGQNPSFNRRFGACLLEFFGSAPRGPANCLDAG